MSRSGRLLDLVQSLRRRRVPTTAAELACELDVSLRTIYRDVAVLVARGVPIRGEPGFGYVLEAGHFLPPLSFTDDELDAVMLGLRWVEKRTDADLARGAEDALAKIAAVLPTRSREAAETPSVFVGPDLPQPAASVDIGLFRNAVRRRLKVQIIYRDANGVSSQRVLWPIGLAFMEDGQFVIAWCELRGAFRHFRLDRIAAAGLGDTFPQRRAQLLRRWRDQLSAEVLDAAISCQ
jgi:predicted DNA-binding transcriptional regulator YafY